LVILESRTKERIHTQKEITERLQAWAAGDEEALDEVINDVYRVLKKLTRRKLRRQSMLATLDPVALVNEVYRYFQQEDNPHAHTQFHSLAAPMIRRILVDVLQKEQIGMRGITVDVSGSPADGLFDHLPMPPVVLLALNNALYKLAQQDPRQCRLVELRCFGGLSLSELANVSGLSMASVKREWQQARQWLTQQLQPGRRLSA